MRFVNTKLPLASMRNNCGRIWKANILDKKMKSHEKSAKVDIQPQNVITGRANWPFQRRHVIKQEYRAFIAWTWSMVNQYEKIRKTHHLVPWLTLAAHEIYERSSKQNNKACPTLYQKIAKFCSYTYSNDSSFLPRELFTKRVWLKYNFTKAKNNQAQANWRVIALSFLNYQQKKSDICLSRTTNAKSKP